MRLFSIRTEGDADAQQDLDRFLRTAKVLAVEKREGCLGPSGSVWPPGELTSPSS